MKKIALYSGFDNIHYEMLGHLLEYFLFTDKTIDIYCPNSMCGIEWLKYYENLFKAKIIFQEPSLFNPDNFDLIFLLTDDDMTFKQEWLDKIGEEKVIVIDHNGKIRREPINMSRLCTRCFYKRPNCHWALPVYNLLNKFEKIKYLSRTNTINVVCMGVQNIPPSVDILKKLFCNFDSINFHIISRIFNNSFNNFKNIKYYLNCQTTLMMELIKCAHYVLFFDNPHNIEPIANSMSGAIPLAFSSGCQIIIPENWQTYYNFKSALTYKDLIVQNNYKTTQMFLTPLTYLDKIYDETYELIHHKNNTLDNLVDKHIKNNNDIFRNYFSIDENISTLINVAVDFTDDKASIQKQSNFFREVNCFINEDLNNKKIFYHFCKEHFINNFVFKINEPCFFNMDSESITENYFSKLSLRGYRDIIVIKTNNQTETIKMIKDNFNKFYSLYTNPNEKIVVLICQR